jgi:hypothetical protein
MVAITSFWASEGTLIRAGTVLASKDPLVQRCPDFYAEARMVPSLEREALRAHECALWAKTTGDLT